MIKVTLRKKPISKGRTSLYLDYYPAIPHPVTGVSTRREFLGLYLFNRPRTVVDRDQNNETLQLAETVRSRRQIDAQNGAYGFLSKESRTACFVKYFGTLAEKRKGSNHDNWVSAQYYLQAFTGGTLTFTNVTLQKCEAFKDYLLTTPSRRNDEPLAINSALSYFNKFKATLKQAYKDGMLPTDLNKQVDPIKQEETHREYLTLEELQALVKTDCTLMPLLKPAGLFSALTGLRFSDVEALTWGQVRHSEAGGFTVVFRQQKTQGTEDMPIPEDAVSVLGPRMADDAPIVPGLVYSSEVGKSIRQWAKDAGIKNKHLSFHCFRHTFATLQLTLGTDLYTLSKMMGHREAKTTQIYGKIVNQLKRDAADRIKL